MTITPGELLETSVAQLRTLVAFLGEQLDGSARGATAQSGMLEVRACQNILVSLTVVLQDAPALDPSMSSPVPGSIVITAGSNVPGAGNS